MVVVVRRVLCRFRRQYSKCLSVRWFKNTPRDNRSLLRLNQCQYIICSINTVLRIQSRVFLIRKLNRGNSYHMDNVVMVNDLPIYLVCTLARCPCINKQDKLICLLRYQRFNCLNMSMQSSNTYHSRPICSAIGLRQGSLVCRNGFPPPRQFRLTLPSCNSRNRPYLRNKHSRCKHGCDKALCRSRRRLLPQHSLPHPNRPLLP